MSERTDELFEAVTNRLVAVIENGETGKWNKPWQSLFGRGFPTNHVTKNEYLGFNTLAFMLTAMEKDYPLSLWATYKQWESVDGQVRKGEKGTLGIKWGKTYFCDSCSHRGQKRCGKGDHTNTYSMWNSTFTVFNIAQVDGITLPEIDELTELERIEEVERFVAATGAEINHVAGDRAYYTHHNSVITMPLAEQFMTQQGYYGTLLHELTHWTGHEDRLNRDNQNRFGTEKYAAEELVAELGSAFLAARFGIEAEPHMEHAAYLKSWVKVLKDDPKNIYTAAKLASEAAAWLTEKAQVAVA